MKITEIRGETAFVEYWTCVNGTWLMQEDYLPVVCLWKLTPPNQQQSEVKIIGDL